MLAAGAGSLAVGVPLTVMPAPLLAAGGLAMFLDSNLMRDYLLFLAGTLCTGTFPRTHITTECMLRLSLVCGGQCCDCCHHFIIDILMM